MDRCGMAVFGKALPPPPCARAAVSWQAGQHKGKVQLCQQELKNKLVEQLAVDLTSRGRHLRLWKKLSSDIRRLHHVNT